MLNGIKAVDLLFLFRLIDIYLKASIAKCMLTLIKACLEYYSALCIAFDFVGVDNPYTSVGQ